MRAVKAAPGKWTTAEPISTLFQRLVAKRYSFVHILDFAFHGVGWMNPATWDCEIYFDVPVSAFGVANGGRPGDVDALIVPRIGSERLFGEAVALEVKTFKVMRRRRAKSPSDFGSEQVRGLARIGFPYVGLLHVAVMEHGSEEEHELLPVWPTDTPLPRDAEPQEWVNLDLSSSAFADRHNPRMVNLNVPECAGVKLFSTIEQPDGSLWGHSVGYERKVTANPGTDDALAARLESALTGSVHMRVGYTRPRFRTRFVGQPR